eukprot:CAMPEP_0184309186 /NCGR_PEP_ID=MMETSP1049-20130417/17435_1 /TAXON_ID=77928 /ORGANISM="Proteomonas sulcata, Strain CCMP704" /LENGTH=58 /DNA_ID=CAMNT_0026622035 /DNA_START=11 /DNA_END=183 /DNA_ORIENTATION=+
MRDAWFHTPVVRVCDGFFPFVHVTPRTLCYSAPPILNDSLLQQPTEQERAIKEANQFP